MDGFPELVSNCLIQEILRSKFVVDLRAWLTASEALKYSDSILNKLLLYQHLVRDVEQRLKREPT